MPVFAVEEEVRFSDVDGMGHVNNAIYLTFLEHARMKFFTQHGARSEKDFPFILAHAAIDYKAPIKMGALLVVKVWTSRIGGKSWDFDYEIRDARNSVLYATAKTVQVAYDYQLEKSDSLEGPLKELVKSLLP